ncbi:uncharacterized protein LOC142774866 [Rhipicephalus microplus]|uniref:uncharacterized protein LOC142774866 n=1 Tax=Rhipicephalus microplus TaxID=6941 RepID=UPI003F6CD290
MQATWLTTACFSLNRQAVSVIQKPCGKTVRRTPLLCSLVQWYLCPGPPRGELPSKCVLVLYPLRLASIPYRDVVLAPPLMSRDKPGTLVDPSAVYPCGSYEAYLEAKKRRQRKKKKEDESKSSDTSSQSGPDERERKEMPRSYFYKALKLPSGRLVDIRYRNKYIRKWARKEAGGEPCQICCAVFIILLLLTILYVYLSNQGWFFSAIAALTPKHSSQAPLDQKSAESTTPFTDTAQEDDESSTVEGQSRLSTLRNTDLLTAFVS